MMGLLTHLQGGLDLSKVPSLAYRGVGGEVVNQDAGTFPLDRRILPDYRLILDQLEKHYDRAFNVWYSQHYDLKRMVTVPLDGGCTWGKRPGRRCKHCSIQGLTPKTTDVASAIPAAGEHRRGNRRERVRRRRLDPRLLARAMGRKHLLPQRHGGGLRQVSHLAEAPVHAGLRAGLRVPRVG